MSGHLDVRVYIYQARYLSTEKLTGRSDPFCAVSTTDAPEDAALKKTDTVIKTVSPIWNEAFDLFDCLETATLRLDLFGQELIADHSLGYLEIPVMEAINNGKLWYPLLHTPTGEIQLEVRTGDSLNDPSDLSLPPHKYKVHYDKFAGTVLAAGKFGSVVGHNVNSLRRRVSTTVGSIGRAFGSALGFGGDEHKETKAIQEETKVETKTTEELAVGTRARGNTTGQPPIVPVVGSSWHSYAVYSVALNSIEDVFKGKLQEWNREYHNAVRIFGPGAATVPVRGLIVTEHKSLFSTLSSQTGTVHTGEQFLNLLNNGWFENRRRRYTYVIINGRMLFSETSKSLAKDFLSKHSVLANAERAVVYSGEFWMTLNEATQKYELVIDNNSGTYAPSTTDLPLLKELLEVNFPDLIVHALAPDDERHKKYRSELEAQRKSSMG